MPALFEPVSFPRRMLACVGAALLLSALAAPSWGRATAAPRGSRSGASAASASPVTSDFNGDGFADLAIGIPGEDVDGIVDAGAVSLLYGSASGLQAVEPDDQVWTASATGATAGTGDQFGAMLAAGDFNGDGFADLAIGSPNQDIGEVVDAGSVTVLYGSPTGLQTASLAPQSWMQGSGGVPDAVEAGDGFGGALAVGDFDGDGYGDLAVGAAREDVGLTTDSGAVVVLAGTAAGLQTTAPPAQEWTEDDLDLPTGGLAGDSFGYALAAGDFDADGHDDLAIGAPFVDLGGSKPDAGRAAVLPGSPGGLQTTNPPLQVWTQDTPGVEDKAERDDRFAASMASGDFDADGHDDLLIGAPWEDVWLEDGSRQVSGAGAFNALYGSGSGLQTGAPADQVWSQETPGVVGLAEHRDRLSFSLATGDLNGDGYDDVAAGVPLEDGGAETIRMSGATNILYGGPGGITSSNDWHLDQDETNVTDGAEPFDRFGWAVAMADFNGDGRADLAVGAPTERVGSVANGGGAHVLYGATGGLQATSPDDMLWTQDASDVADQTESGDTMGASAAAG